jgi:hypothetical protein
MLNETRHEIAEEMRGVQAEIGKHQEAIQRAQKEVQLAEGREEVAISEDEYAQQRATVLRTYLNGLEKHPAALLGKAKRIAAEQARAADARQVAGKQIVTMRNDLRGRHTQIAAAEQRYAALRKQWSEVSELISTAQQPA